MTAIRDVVKTYIFEELLEDADPEMLTWETELIRSGILDSMATLALRGYLEDTYDIEIDSHEIDFENFGTITTIERLVQTKLPD